MASLDKRPVEIDQRLVCAVFWSFGVSADRVVVAKIRRRQIIRLGSAFACGALLRCGEDCVENRNLTGEHLRWRSVTRMICRKGFERNGDVSLIVG